MPRFVSYVSIAVSIMRVATRQGLSVYEYGPVNIKLFKDLVKI